MEAHGTIIFIGDSLTEFFDWQGRFPGYRVLNLGVAGETVEGLLNRLDRVMLNVHHPDYIFVMTGINDIAMEEYGIAAPYKQIVNKLFSVFDRSTIVIQSILPVLLPWVDGKTIEKINGELQEIAKSYMARYLDLYSLFTDASGAAKSEYLSKDGVHLSGEGYSVWAKALEEFLDSERTG